MYTATEIANAMIANLISKDSFIVIPRGNLDLQGGEEARPLVQSGSDR
jgi:hypothetical protein